MIKHNEVCYYFTTGECSKTDLSNCYERFLKCSIYQDIKLNAEKERLSLRKTIRGLENAI